MASVSTSIDIGTSPDRVWDLVTDLDRLGEWVTIHRALRDAAPATIEDGTTFSQTLEVAGTPFDVEWTATMVDAPGHLVWEGAGPAGSRARTSYALAAHDGGTPLHVGERVRSARRRGRKRRGLARRQGGRGVAAAAQAARGRLSA